MEQHKYIKQIGFGEHPIHYAIRQSDSRQVAIKKIPFGNMSKQDKQRAVDQVNSMMDIKSASHVVKYYGHYIDKGSSQLYIFMEYCKGGSLENYLAVQRNENKLLAEKTIWEIVSQIVMGLSELHHEIKTHIVHRNIKPSNVFLDDEKKVVKIGDLGHLARLNSDKDFSKTLNTNTYYLSPQQIQGMGCTIKTDIWALGCLIYQMATLKHPFAASQEFQIIKKIKSGRIPPLPSHYSRQLARVIHLCLSKSPEDRPSAHEILYYPEICVRIKQKQVRSNKTKLKNYRQEIEQKERQVQELEQEVRLLILQMETQNLSLEKVQSSTEKEGDFRPIMLLAPKRSLY